MVVVDVVGVETVDSAGNLGKEGNKECCNKKEEGGERDKIQATYIWDNIEANE